MFYNDEDEPIDVSTLATSTEGNILLPLDYYVDIRVPGVSKYDAWEFKAIFDGNAELEVDFDPDTSSSGAIFGWNATSLLGLTIDEDVDGAQLLTGQAHPSAPTVPDGGAPYYRNTPNYVAVFGDGTGGSPGAQGIIFPRLLEAELPITGWVRIKATDTSQDVELISLDYKAISREWVQESETYYDSYGHREYIDTCEPATVLQGCVGEIQRWITAVDDDPSPFFSHRDVGTVTPAGGMARTVRAFHTQNCAIDTAGAGDFILTFEDPAPDPVTGNLWPTPHGRVQLTVNFICFSFDPLRFPQCVPCGECSTEVDLQFDFPLADYRGGFHIEVTAQGDADDCDPCEAGCVQPSQCNIYSWDYDIEVGGF